MFRWWVSRGAAEAPVGERFVGFVPLGRGRDERGRLRWSIQIRWSIQTDPPASFFALVRSWGLTVHLPRARRLSAHTIRSYKTALTTLLDYLRETRGVELADVTFDVLDHATIAGFSLWLVETRHMAPSSANQRLDGLGRVCR